MENIIVTNILLDILIVLPISIIALYLTFYLTSYFSLFKRIENERIEIRTNVLSYWSKKYKSLEQFFSNIPISDIRLVALSDKRRIKKFRNHQFLYLIFSFIILISSIIFKNIENNENILYIFYFCSFFLIIYLLYSFFLGSMTFYEWKFYNKLDKLEIEIENQKENKLNNENNIEKIWDVPFNDQWALNFRKSECSKILNNIMIFEGTDAPTGSEVSFIDKNNILDINRTYEISCFAKSDPKTTGKFQLWCHDKTGASPNGVKIITAPETPPIEGKKIKLMFKAMNNNSIRIHLLYKPGDGKIQISDVRIKEIKLLPLNN